MMTWEAPRFTEFGLMVSAVPVPVLVADYNPIIERFSGMSGEEVRALLLGDDALFEQCLSLPRAIAASPEWDRLYGSILSPDTPDLHDRQFSKDLYPDLYETLIQQFTAPFFRHTSIVREHTAPTVFGQVIVRSHWSAPVDGDQALWDRIVIVDLDVTDLRSAQRELKQILDAKQLLVESKDQLIASVSHEIRTPLASIVGFAGLLQEESDLSAEERLEMTGVLVQQSNDLTNIVDDLLVAAKANVGQLEVARVSVDLRAQTAQVVEGLDAESRAVVSSPQETVRCMGDPGRVRQIVRNLISNALKYGGPVIVLEVGADETMGSLVVTDNGVGVPEEFRAKIFSAYERGVQPVGLAPSLGLGLHISLVLAQLMGGDLNYCYEDGKSRFQLSLPLDLGQLA